MVLTQIIMVAILGAIMAVGSIGMVTTVRADSGDGFGSFGPGGWHCDWQYNSNGYKVCESYNQKPTVQSIDWHCIWQKDSNGYDVCIYSVQQPTMKQTGWEPHQTINNDERSCHVWDGGYMTCPGTCPFGYVTHQAQLQQTSINCVKHDDGMNIEQDMAPPSIIISSRDWSTRTRNNL